VTLFPFLLLSEFTFKINGSYEQSHVNRLKSCSALTTRSQSRFSRCHDGNVIVDKNDKRRTVRGAN